MADILRVRVFGLHLGVTPISEAQTISKFGLSKALSTVHLVETSEALRKVQEEKLTKSPFFGSPNVQFHNHLSEIPRSPSEYTILVAHEFFDALPIHVLQV